MNREKKLSQVDYVTGLIGGMAGSWALHRINEKLLRVLVVCIGITLTIGLFLRG